jgi:hypothetical protein
VITDSTYALTTSFDVYAGNQYILRLARNTSSTAFWPVLVRPTLGNEYAPLPANAGNSISFFSTMKLSGGATLNEYQRGLSIFATGTDGTAYRFGFSGMWQDTATTPIWVNGGPNDGFLATSLRYREQRCWFSDTASFEVTTKTFNETSRESSPTYVQQIGKGKLLALQTVMEQAASVDFNGTDYVTTFQPFVLPKLWSSSDHGATWSSTPASFLLPYLYYTANNNGAFGGAWTVNYATLGDRLVVSNRQLLNMASGARFIYVGNSTVLLIVPFCYLGGTGPGEQWATLLFRSTAGGAFTRVTWPADAWIASSQTSVSEPFLTSLIGYFYNGCWSLGPGHAFVPVQYASGAVKILYTQDSGNTWTLSPAVPTDVVYPLTGAFYATPLTTGVALVPKLDTSANTLTWMRTTSTFDVYTPVGNVQAGSALAPAVSDLSGYAGRFFINLGGRFNPAYPNEFDQ